MFSNNYQGNGDQSWQLQEPRYTVVKLNLGLTSRYLVRLPMLVNFYVRMATLYVSLFPPSFEFVVTQLARATEVLAALRAKSDQYAYLREVVKTDAKPKKNFASPY